MTINTIPLPIHRGLPASPWMPPAGIRIISADDHNMEAEHLWEERLPAEFRERAPKLWRDDRGWHFEVSGKSADLPGIGPHVSESQDGFWDIDERLKGMDAEGIEASLIFHGRLQSLNMLIGSDPDLYWACIDVYNEWLAECLKGHADRLIGVPVLPTFLRPEATADYLAKLKGLGFKALQMPSFPRGIRYNSRAMDPLWSAVQDSGIPISFHVGAVLEFQGYGSLGANLSRNLCPFRPLLGQLIFSGVMERHPHLRFVFTEGGAGWVADALYGMDKLTREYYSELRPQLSELPSFYWRRQCHATFMDDPVAMRCIDLIGADNVLWSIDFPHAEGVHGYAGEVAKRIYDTLGHDDAKKVLGGNAARLWNI